MTWCRGDPAFDVSLEVRNRMYILYDFVFLVFAIIYLPYLFLTKRYHSRLIERLGVFSRHFFRNLRGKQLIWLHAVSVGEVMAASSFIKDFKKNFPGHKLIISTVTKTGNQAADSIKGENDALIYFPLDLSFIVRRLLDKIEVKLFIIMETELWPNIVTELSKKGIPIVLMNGRLSERSFKAYGRVMFLLKNAFNKINLFCMQTTGDADRLKRLGIAEDKIKVTGNMKYDVAQVSLTPEEKARLRLSLGLDEDKKMLIAGSTHHGEDEIIVKAYVKLLKEFPSLRLLLAPRHVGRTPDIEEMVLQYSLKSQRFAFLGKGFNEVEVIILNVMGKLRDLYAISDIVLMGGSLLPRYGGHNLLEPAAFKKPILFGPHMSNFKDMAGEFLARGAAAQAKNGEDIEELCKELIASPLKADKMGEAAFGIIEKNRGATLKNFQNIIDILVD